MAEPLKNLFDVALIRCMAAHLQRAEKSFDKRRFTALASRELAALELKQRASQITDALEACLPASFDAACRIMVATLHPAEQVELSEMQPDDAGLRGWAIMPMADYVARHGRHDLELSMATLKAFTKRFSAEFAIRPFIVEHPRASLQLLRRWTRDENVHVRRLVSEGLRPRLPWAIQLPAFIENPAPLLPVLERLRDDDAEYVRRSVANNLNDISRDHPDLIAEVARDWHRGASAQRRQLLRHACRTLIKRGDPDVLALLGYDTAHVDAELEVTPPQVSVGEPVTLEVKIRSTGDSAQALLLDYIVHHRRANGGTSAKTFKWTTFELPAATTRTISRSHSFRPVTTRRYHAGRHRIEIQVNGAIMAGADVELNL